MMRPIQLSQEALDTIQARLENHLYGKTKHLPTNLGTGQILPAPQVHAGSALPEETSVSSDDDELAWCQRPENHLTYWEELALMAIVERGPMYAGQGSSAIFDAAWNLQRRGLLRVDYSSGPPYLHITDAALRLLGREP